MSSFVPEPNKIPGLSYAVSDEGWELPVIDIAHPAFALQLTHAELNAIPAATELGLRLTLKIPRFIRRFLGRHSILMRDAGKPYLGGMTTYLQKLGPASLSLAYA